MALLAPARPCPVLTLDAGRLCDATSADWTTFAALWDDLPRDTHMADGGRYRNRRHAVFTLAGGALERLPHRAHYQERRHNALNGGVARWFAPMDERGADSAAFRTIVTATAALIEARDPALVRNWTIEAHQFRIQATPGQPGLPTPEGMHRDGRDWVLILFMGAHNMLGGLTDVEDAAGRLLLRHRLARPGEALLLDDRLVRHGTSPIAPADHDAPAWRDTLVLTFADAGD